MNTSGFKYFAKTVSQGQAVVNALPLKAHAAVLATDIVRGETTLL